jgi:hypothetical protein
MGSLYSALRPLVMRAFVKDLDRLAVRSSKCFGSVLITIQIRSAIQLQWPILPAHQFAC